MNPDPLKEVSIEMLWALLAVIVSILISSALESFAAGQVASAMIPPPATNRPVRHYWPQPANVARLTNIMVSWRPYTNVVITVEGSTNLADWYFKTNVPVIQNSVIFPNQLPAEFYRTSINLLTN